MDMPTVIAVALVVGLGAAQYILMVQALRDLQRRPRVRGDNKVAWGLIILCVPIIGPIVYGWMGPTSLIRRPYPEPSHTTVPPSPTSDPPNTRRNITPISEARRRSRNLPPALPTERPTPRRFRRTGS